MDPQIQKEQFSIAYVRAIAAVTGLKVLRTDVDDDSIDIGLERTGGVAPKLDLQLKCTADPLPSSGDISFVLKKKNYDDLRRPTVVPRWLVTFYVPSNVSDWLTISTPPTSVLLQRSAWWLSLTGLPAADNTTSVTVHLPRPNIFTSDALTQALNEIETGFVPL